VPLPSRCCLKVQPCDEYHAGIPVVLVFLVHTALPEPGCGGGDLSASRAWLAECFIFEPEFDSLDVERGGPKSGEIEVGGLFTSTGEHVVMSRFPILV
jgi:hypothetical protein